MLKKCLTLSLAAAMISLGVVSDSSAANEPETFEQTLTKCRKSYLAFKKNGNNNLIKEFANAYPTVEMKQGFAVICLTYAIGYEDGIEGRV